MFILGILTHILHFSLWRHVKAERKGFGEKCKQTELALSFVKKENSILVKKTSLPFILVEKERREPGKSCF